MTTDDAYRSILLRDPTESTTTSGEVLNGRGVDTHAAVSGVPDAHQRWYEDREETTFTVELTDPSLMAWIHAQQRRMFEERCFYQKQQLWKKPLDQVPVQSPVYAIQGGSTGGTVDTGSDAFLRLALPHLLRPVKVRNSFLHLRVGQQQQRARQQAQQQRPLQHPRPSRCSSSTGTTGATQRK